MVLHERGEDGLELEGFPVDLKAGGKVEPSPALLDDLRAPALGAEDQRLVADLGSKSHLPLSPLKRGDAVVPEALPIEFRMRPFLRIGRPESAFEIRTRKLAQGLRRLFGAGMQVESIERVQRGRLGGTVAGDLALGRHDRWQNPTR